MDTATKVDAAIRRQIYESTLRRGSPPTIHELSELSGESPDDVAAALRRLSTARIVVLQSGSGEILMAPPFSAVPTPFVVHTAAHSSYANCAWDALGVSVMMHQPAQIVCACSCCGEALNLRTRMDGLPEGDAVMHFAIPARRWWDDIVFT
jgi:hypothetical protein